MGNSRGSRRKGLSLDVSERLDGARTRLGDAEGLTHEVILLAEQRRAFVDATRGIDWLKNRPFPHFAQHHRAVRNKPYLPTLGSC